MLPLNLTRPHRVGILSILIFTGESTMHDQMRIGSHCQLPRGIPRFWTQLSGILLWLLLSGCAQGPDLERLKAKYTNTDSRWIEVMGMSVHYRDEGQGPVLVLLHGTGSSLHTWDEWTAILKARFRVIRPDLPGSGLTGPHPQRRYEVSDDVAFLREFLTALQLSKVHLIGNSLGGRIAWDYALSDPDTVTSLTLINALGYPQESWPPAIRLAQVPVIDQLMATTLPRFIFRQSLGDIYHPDFPLDDARVDRYYELAQREGNLQAFTDRVKARLDEDSERIRALRTPTLILWGEQDRYFPVSHAHRFHADIAGSRLTVFPSVGHLPMEEVPLASAEALMAFLDATSGDGAQSIPDPTLPR